VHVDLVVDRPTIAVDDRALIVEGRYAEPLPAAGPTTPSPERSHA
jgi:hypothetical protein